MRAPEEPASQAELQRRLNVGRAILTERPPTPRTIELAVLALSGATADDLLDVLCRECWDMPKTGRHCAACGLTTPAEDVA